MKRAHHILALILLVLCAVLPARGDQLPVGLGNCATEKYPILIVNDVSYGPGVSTDTIDLTLWVDSLVVQFVMGMDDSSGATPPCDCDTMDRSGELGATSHNNMYYKMTVFEEGPFPHGQTTPYDSTEVYDLADWNATCPDTFAVGTIGFERCGDAKITAEGAVYWGGVDGAGGSPLAPSGDNVVIPVRVSMPASSGGTFVIMTVEE